MLYHLFRFLWDHFADLSLSCQDLPGYLNHIWVWLSAKWSAGWGLIRSTLEDTLKSSVSGAMHSSYSTRLAAETEESPCPPCQIHLAAVDMSHRSTDGTYAAMFSKEPAGGISLLHRCPIWTPLMSICTMLNWNESRLPSLKQKCGRNPHLGISLCCVYWWLDDSWVTL